MNDSISLVLGKKEFVVKPDSRMGPENPYLWMAAGVVKFKDCKIGFDCIGCKYDKAMAVKASKGKQMTWQDSMRRRAGMDRTCRHTLTNRIEGRICAYNYECHKCDFDQMFEDIYSNGGRLHINKGEKNYDFER